MNKKKNFFNEKQEQKVTAHKGKVKFIKKENQDKKKKIFKFYWQAIYGIR